MSIISDIFISDRRYIIDTLILPATQILHYADTFSFSATSFQLASYFHIFATDTLYLAILAAIGFRH
jgi:hypothetical protein